MFRAHVTEAVSSMDPDSTEAEVNGLMLSTNHLDKVVSTVAKVDAIKKSREVFNQEEHCKGPGDSEWSQEEPAWKSRDRERGLGLVGNSRYKSRHLRSISYPHKNLRTRNKKVWRKWRPITTLLDTSLVSLLWMTKKTTTFQERLVSHV